MEIRKTVDLETLTEEERDMLDNGEKTEEDFIKEAEEAEKAKQEQILEEAKKKDELIQNYKIRAEKAEKKKVDNETPKNELSQKDLIALIKADVSEDDFDEVTDYAKLKNIPVSEALKSSVIRTVLSEKKEERATAQATATGNKGAGSKASSGSELLRKAETTGEIPKDDADLEKLIEADLKR